MAGHPAVEEKRKRGAEKNTKECQKKNQTKSFLGKNKKNKLKK